MELDPLEKRPGPATGLTDSDVIIRTASFIDAAAIAEIYNHYIRTSHSTFETDVIDAAEMLSRIEVSANNNYQFLVAELDVKIIGYAYAHRFRERQAYRNSVEVSVYTKPGFENRGIGKRLYGKLFPLIQDAGFHTIIAGISLPNDVSIRLHESFGMTKVAHFRQVGRKFDRWIDVGYWQLILDRADLPTST